MAVEWITAVDLALPADVMAEDSAAAASWVLYNLSGRKYPGIRTAKEWYGFDHRECWCNPVGEISQRAHGVAHLARMSEGSRLRLRQKPVQEVLEVSDYSGVRDRDTFYLVNDAYLINLNTASWDFVRGVEVTYRYGTPPPVLGKNAAITLANEFVKMYKDSTDCQLPERVTSVNRQGVSLTIMDPQDFIKDGRTGIYEVDLFLSVANPSRALKKARVFSPDKPRGERRR